MEEEGRFAYEEEPRKRGSSRMESSALRVSKAISPERNILSSRMCRQMPSLIGRRAGESKGGYPPSKKKTSVRQRKAANPPKGTQP